MNKLSWKYFRSQIAWLLACIMIFNPFAELSLGLIQISAAPIAQDLMLSQNEIEEILEDTDYQGIELESEELPFKKSIRQELEMFLEDQLDEGYILLKQSLNDNILTLIMANVPEETTNGCPTSNIKVVVINGDNSELNLNVKVAGNQLNVDEGSVSYYTVNTSTKTKVHSDSDSDVYTPSEATVYSPSEPEQEVIDSDGHFDLSEEAISLLDADSEDANAPTMMFKSTKRAGGLGLNVSQDSIMVLDLSTVAYANVFDFADAVHAEATANPKGETIAKLYLNDYPSGTVKAGETLIYSYEVITSVTPTYNFDSVGYQGIYDALEDVRVYIKLPAALAAVSTENEKWVKDEANSDENYVVYYQDKASIKTTGGNTASEFEVSVTLTGNGTRAIGETFTLPADYMWMTCKYTVVDKDAPNPDANTAQKEYSVRVQPKTAVADLGTTITTTSDDEWHIEKVINTENGKAEWIYNSDSHSVELEYWLKVGFLNDAGHVTNDAGKYAKVGRTGFDSFKISDKLWVTAADENPTMKPLYTRVYLGEQLIYEDKTEKTSFEIEDKYATKGFDAYNVDAKTPTYTQYKVVVGYPYEDFVLDYNDPRGTDRATYLVHNSAQLDYELSTVGDAEKKTSGPKKVETLVKIQNQQATLEIKKEILDVLRSTKIPYDVDAEKKYPGAAQFKIEKKVGTSWVAYTKYSFVPISEAVVLSDTPADKGIYVNPTIETNENLPYATEDNSITLYLDEGTYRVTEIGAPSGTTKASNPIEVTVSKNEPGTVTFVNTPETGALKFKKYGKDSNTQSGLGTVLAGAEFGLYKAGSTTPIAKATSDANGVVAFDKVPAGTYELKEISAPNGYTMSSDVSCVVTIDKGILLDDTETNNIAKTFINKRNLGTLTVTKWVQNDPDKIPTGNEFIKVPDGLIKEFKGAFHIEKHTSGGWVDVDSTTSYSLSSNDLTQAQFTASLPALDEKGNKIQYRVVETLPNGYGPKSDVGTTEDTTGTKEYTDADKKHLYRYFELDPAGNVALDMFNIRAGKLVVTKQHVSVKTDGTGLVYDSSEANVKDLEFELYKKTGNTFSRVGTYTTDSTGKISVSGLEVLNVASLVQYYLVEKNTKSGTMLDVKVPTGVHYKMETIDLPETSENVPAIGPITLSRIKDINITAYNVEQKIPHWIRKFDEYTNRPVDGAEIIVTNSSGHSVYDGSIPNVDSAEYGKMILLEAGEIYTIKETEAPANYELNSKEYTVNAPDTVDVDTLLKILNNTNSVRVTDHTTKITNIPYPKVKIKKELYDDQQTTSLNNVTFDVYKKNGSDYEIVGSLKSNQASSLAPGIYYFTENVDWATEKIVNPYYLYETGDTSGTLKAKYTWEKLPNTLDKAELDTTGKRLFYGPYTISRSTLENYSTVTQLFSAMNLKNTSDIQLKKVNSTNTELVVPGATIKLSAKVDGQTYQENGQAYERTGVTDKDGKVSFSNLPVMNSEGKLIHYTLVETNAPKGYFINETPIELILEPGKDITTVMKDDPHITLRVPKVWMNTWEYEYNKVGHLIGNVKLALFEVDKSGNVTWIKDATTNVADGIATFTGLHKDKTYYIAEVTTPTVEETGGIRLVMPPGKEALPKNYKTAGAVKLDDLKNKKYNTVEYQWKLSDTLIAEAKAIENLEPWTQFNVTKLCNNATNACGPLNAAIFELYRQKVNPNSNKAELNYSYSDLQGSGFELIGEYESGTKLDPNTGMRVDGEFDTDILETGYIYWLVETKSAPNHMLPGTPIAPETVQENPVVVGIFAPNGTAYTYDDTNNYNHKVTVLPYQEAKVTEHTVYNNHGNGDGSDQYLAQIKLTKFLSNKSKNELQTNATYKPLGGATYEIWLTTDVEPGKEGYKEIIKVDEVTTGLESDYDSDKMTGHAMSGFIDLLALKNELEKDPTYASNADNIIKAITVDITENGAVVNKNALQARFVLKEIEAPSKITMSTDPVQITLTAVMGKDNINDQCFNANGDITKIAESYRLINWPENDYVVKVNDWGYTPIFDTDVSKTTFGKTDDQLNEYSAEEIVKTPLSNVTFKLEKKVFNPSTGAYEFKPYDFDNGTNGIQDVFVVMEGQKTLVLPSGQYRMYENTGFESTPNNKYFNAYPTSETTNGRYRSFEVTNENLTVDVYNPAKPELRVKKTDWDGNTNAALEGITFTLKETSANKVLTAVTEKKADSEGNEEYIAVFSNLENGSYEITAEKLSDSANAYVTDKYFNKITVGKIAYAFGQDVTEPTIVLDSSYNPTAAAGNVFECTVKNPRLADLEITKKNSVTDAVINGVTFDLYYLKFRDSDFTGTVLKAENTLVAPAANDFSSKLLTTNATGTDGKVKVTDLAPGWYMIKENFVPEDYVKSDAAYIIHIDGDLGSGTEYTGTVAYEIKNDPKVRLTVNKELTYGDLLKPEDSDIAGMQIEFELYKQRTTTENGSATVEYVPYDPDGDGKAVKFTVKNFVANAIGVNAYLNSAGDNSELVTMLENGERYALKEVAQYRLNNGAYVKLTDAEWLLPQPDQDDNWTKATDANGQEYIVLKNDFNGMMANVPVTVKNEYAKAKVIIAKVDEEDDTKCLEKAEFGLYSYGADLGNDADDVKVTSFTETDKGIYEAEVFMDGLDEVTYYIKEEKAPAGYVLSEAKTPVILQAKTIKRFDTETSLQLTNKGGMDILLEKYGDVYDSVAPQLLTNPAVTFKLYQKANGSGSWEAVENGSRTTQNGTTSWIGLDLTRGQQYALMEETVKDQNGYITYTLESVYSANGTQAFETETATVSENGVTKNIVLFKLPTTAHTPGTVYECKAYNEPSKAITITKKNLNVNNEATPVDSSVKIQITDVDGNAVGNDLLVPYGGSINVYLEAGKTYIIKETEVVLGAKDKAAGRDLIINKDDDRVKYEQQYTVPTSGIGEVSLEFSNVELDDELGLRKSVVAPTALESIWWHDDQTVQYRLTPTVKNTYPLDSFVVWDQGLTYLNSHGGNDTELSYEDYAKEKYTITEVQLSPVDYKNYVRDKVDKTKPAEVGTIKAEVTFYGFREDYEVAKTDTKIAATLASLDSLTLQDTVIVEVPYKEGNDVVVKPSVNGKFQSVKVEYFAESLFQNSGFEGAEGYKLPQEFEPGDILITAEIDEQTAALENQSSTGAMQYRIDIDKIRNDAVVVMEYREWNEKGQLASTKTMDTADSAASVVVNDPKAPVVKISKSVTKGEPAIAVQQVEIGDTITYVLTTDNLEATSTDNPMIDPILVDLMPVGVKADISSTKVYIDGNELSNTDELKFAVSDIIALNAENGQEILVFPFKGELKAGQKLEVKINAAVTQKAELHSRDIQNNVYLTSAKENNPISGNDYGNSFKGSVSEQVVWPNTGLSSALLKAITASGVGGTWADNRFISSLATNSIESGSSLVILKEVKGNLDEHYVYDTSGKMEKTTDSITDTPAVGSELRDGEVSFKLSVKNYSENKVIGQIRIADVLSVQSDGRHNKGSNWPLEFIQIESVNLVDPNKGTTVVSKDNYKLYYSTATVTSALQSQLAAELKKENASAEINGGLLNAWSENVDKSSITAFAIVVDRTDLTANQSLEIEYRAKVKATVDQVNEHNFYYEPAFNDFSMVHYRKENGTLDLYSNVLNSNIVEVFLSPSVVKVGGKVWLDDNADGVQNDDRTSTYRDALLEKIRTKYTKNVVLYTYNGDDLERTTTGLINAETGSFLFDGLLPARPIMNP